MERTLRPHFGGIPVLSKISVETKSQTTVDFPLLSLQHDYERSSWKKDDETLKTRRMMIKQSFRKGVTYPMRVGNHVLQWTAQYILRFTKSYDSVGRVTNVPKTPLHFTRLAPRNGLIQV